MSFYDPLRATGWSEERIQTWLATPLPLLENLSPSQLDASTLQRLIHLVARPVRIQNEDHHS